ncbi:hypothetical protein NQZ68_032156 [Dissostichus eleginoides]|nr:hypothetical protein NQZ68_032156 [Dissostichus eleginoides]
MPAFSRSAEWEGTEHGARRVPPLLALLDTKPIAGGNELIDIPGNMPFRQLQACGALSEGLTQYYSDTVPCVKQWH